MNACFVPPTKSSSWRKVLQDPVFEHDAYLQAKGKALKYLSTSQQRSLFQRLCQKWLPQGIDNPARNSNCKIYVFVKWLTQERHEMEIFLHKVRLLFELSFERLEFFLALSSGKVEFLCILNFLFSLKTCYFKILLRHAHLFERIRLIRYIKDYESDFPNKLSTAQFQSFLTLSIRPSSLKKDSTLWAQHLFPACREYAGIKHVQREYADFLSTLNPYVQQALLHHWQSNAILALFRNFYDNPNNLPEGPRNPEALLGTHFLTTLLFHPLAYSLIELFLNHFTELRTVLNEKHLNNLFLPLQRVKSYNENHHIIYFLKELVRIKQLNIHLAEEILTVLTLSDHLRHSPKLLHALAALPKFLEHYQASTIASLLQDPVGRTFLQDIAEGRRSIDSFQEIFVDEIGGEQIISDELLLNLVSKHPVLFFRLVEFLKTLTQKRYNEIKYLGTIHKVLYILERLPSNANFKLVDLTLGLCTNQVFRKLLPKFKKALHGREPRLFDFASCIERLGKIFQSGPFVKTPHRVSLSKCLNAPGQNFWMPQINNYLDSTSDQALLDIQANLTIVCLHHFGESSETVERICQIWIQKIFLSQDALLDKKRVSRIVHYLVEWLVTQEDEHKRLILLNILEKSSRKCPDGAAGGLEEAFDAILLLDAPLEYQMHVFAHLFKKDMIRVRLTTANSAENIENYLYYVAVLSKDLHLHSVTKNILYPNLATKFPYYFALGCVMGAYFDPTNLIAFVAHHPFFQEQYTQERKILREEINIQVENIFNDSNLSDQDQWAQAGALYRQCDRYFEDLAVERLLEAGFLEDNHTN